MLARLDRRTKEARYVAKVIVTLTAHVGMPSATQAPMIKRVAWLSLRLALLDEQLGKGADLSLEAANVYMLCSNGLTRTLARLGLESAASSARDVAAWLSAVASALEAAKLDRLGGRQK